MDDPEHLPIQIKHFDELSALELYRILRAREQVFFLEQGVDCEDIDGVDIKSTHMWCESKGETVAYLRMIPAGISYRQPSIGRVLVAPQWRREGISRRLMETAVSYMTANWDAREIMISAQAYLVDYYSDLGFHVVSEEYLDGGIPHYKMLMQSNYFLDPDDAFSL